MDSEEDQKRSVINGTEIQTEISKNGGKKREKRFWGKDIGDKGMMHEAYDDWVAAGKPKAN